MMNVDHDNIHVHDKRNNGGKEKQKPVHVVLSTGNIKILSSRLRLQATTHNSY